MLSYIVATVEIFAGIIIHPIQLEPTPREDRVSSTQQGVLYEYRCRS